MEDVEDVIPETSTEMVVSNSALATSDSSDWYSDFRDKMQTFGGEMVTIKSDLVSIGREVVGLRREVVGLRDDIGSAGKAMDNRLEELRREIDRLRRSKKFNSDLWSRLSPLVPALFHSKGGECGWVPVTFDGKNFVVVGIKQSEVILKTRFNLTCTATEFATALRNALPETLLFDKSNKKDLEQLLMLTPFMPCANWYDASGEYTRGSDRIKNGFIVVDASTWKETILERAEDCARAYTMDDQDTADRAYSSSSKIKLHQWSLLEERDDREPFIAQLNRRLTLDDKERMPSFLVPWWKELVNESYCEIFDVDSSKPHHVAFGKRMEGETLEDGSVVKARFIVRGYHSIANAKSRYEDGEEFSIATEITDKFLAQNRTCGSAYKVKKCDPEFSNFSKKRKRA